MVIEFVLNLCEFLSDICYLILFVGVDYFEHIAMLLSEKLYFRERYVSHHQSTIPCRTNWAKKKLYYDAIGKKTKRTFF